MNDKPDSINETKLAEKARESLREHSLSHDVQRKLRLARAEAVEQLAQKESFAATLFGRGRWMVAFGSVAAIVVAVTINQGESVPPMPAFDEQEFAAASEMDMLEDIEFLAWMLEQNEAQVPDDG